MWTTGDRPDRDAYEPNEGEIVRDLAAAYDLGDSIDSSLHSVDAFEGLNSYFLAAARTDADAEHLAAAYEAGLAASTSSAEVVDLAARRRRAVPHPDRGELRAA